MAWHNPWTAEARFDAELLPYRQRADRIMLRMSVFLTLVVLLLAPLRGEWLAAIAMGGGTLGLGAWLVRHLPGTSLTRLYMGCAFMVYTGLVIHETGGSIEAHFTAFGLCGVLLYYRDWRVIAVATLFIYLHHLVLGWLQTQGWGVYVFDTPAFWTKFAVHVAYFLPFVVLMGYLAISLRREGHENRLVIRLAREVAEGDFTRGQSAVGELGGLLQSVEHMREWMVELLRSMPTAVMIVRLDDGLVADANPAWARLLGWTTRDVAGRPVTELPIWAAGPGWSELLPRLQAPDGLPVELTLERADGQQVLALLSGVEYRTERLALLVVGFEDVTLRREAERRMRHLALHDPLTNLPNRAALITHLQAALDAGRAGKRQADPHALVVMMLDLDDFKPVNDSHGHDAGDLVLQTLAQRLGQGRRSDDFLARLGGDEFVLVARAEAGPEAMLDYARRLQALASAPIALPQAPGGCQVGLSIGLAWFDRPALPRTVDAVLAQADRALYTAKRAGKGRVEVLRGTADPAPDAAPSDLQDLRHPGPAQPEGVGHA